MKKIAIQFLLVTFVLIWVSGCTLFRTASIKNITSPITFHKSQFTPFKGGIKLAREGEWGYGYIEPTPVLTGHDLHHAFKITEESKKKKISLVLTNEGVNKLRKLMNRLDDIQLSIVMNNRILKTEVYKVNEVIPYVINIPQ